MMREADWSLTSLYPTGFHWLQMCDEFKKHFHPNSCGPNMILFWGGGGGGGVTVEDSGRLVFILAGQIQRKVRMKVPVRQKIGAVLRFPGFVVISIGFG